MSAAFGFDSGDVYFFGTRNNVIHATRFTNAGYVGGDDLEVRLDGHEFIKVCTVSCNPSCPATLPSSAGCGPFSYVVSSSSGPVCISFETALPFADNANSTSLVSLPGQALNVTINDIAIRFHFGAVATSNGGRELLALVLGNFLGDAFFFSSCGPTIFLRGYTFSFRVSSLGKGILLGGTAPFTSVATASGTAVASDTLTSTAAVVSLPNTITTTDNTSLIAGTVAGSLVGSLGFLAVVALAVFFFLRWRKSKAKSATEIRARSGDTQVVSARNEYGYGQVAPLKSHYADGAAAFKEGLPQDSGYTQLRATETEGPYAATAAAFKWGISEDSSYAQVPAECTGAVLPQMLKGQRKSTLARAHEWLFNADELKLGAVLGVGAFGIVRRAEWGEATVAVKQIKKSTLGGTDKAVADFEAEIGRMAALEPHESVVQLFGVVELRNGDVGAVMEFCAHGALADALYGDKARVMSEAQMWRIAGGAARGLVHLHAHKIVHRDIAARNVLLAGDELQPVAKLSDFGMARDVSESMYSDAEQQTKASIGPVRWMAPEQLERLAYSKASDVFAFGVLLYEIFARSQPWPGVANVNVITSVVAGRRMEVSRGVPAQMRELMAHCWAHEPTERPSADTVCSEINQRQ
jgi:hypothetical protein